MAENGTTVLDTEFLKNFIRNEITEFKSSLEKILKNSPDGPSVVGIAEGDASTTTRVNSPKPLVVGAMGGQGSNLAAGELNKAIANTAEKLKELLKNHKGLFDEIEDALEATVAELSKTQKTSLDQISGEMFMDIFEDVDDDFGGSKGSSDEDDDD